MSKVGFIGLGIMGKPMAKNLLKAGVELMVCDVNEEAVNEVRAAGASGGNYAEISSSCLMAKYPKRYCLRMMA